MPPSPSQPDREIMPRVSVNGAVLEWARSLRGLSLDDAASLLRIPAQELKAYELEETQPLVGVLRLMSRKYKLNFTSFFMPGPLPVRKKPADHRTRSRQKVALSLDTILAIEEVTEALDAFEAMAEADHKLLPAFRAGRARMNESPESVAARERERFGVSIAEQKSWHDLPEARRKWRRRIEDLGIFTYMIQMPPQELSGFSICRDSMAAICVNDREPTEGAKIFTLFHEYCHVLLRQTGISDENNISRVEHFCNQFAANFLIPRESLVYEIGEVPTPFEFSDSDVKRLAARFKVSNSVMALRLQETKIAPAGFYDRHISPWDIPLAKVKKNKNPAGGPRYIPMQLKKIGRLHAATVLAAAKRKVINSFDASQLVGLQSSSFPKLASRIAE
jgi:Zn-dependent peptidase ImmA (M78 family)